MRLLLLLLALCVSCSGNGNGNDDADAAPPDCSGFVGDPSLPVEIEPIVTLPEAYNDLGEIARVKPVACEDGMRVPLIQAPQGGKHIFAGVRVRNLDTCPVRLVGTIRDTSGFISFEGRPVNMKVAEDGWAYASQPEQIANYANIGVCPNRWSSRDLFEQPYELELRVSDRGSRSAQVSVSITPYCGEPSRERICACECTKGVVCPAADAGPTPR